MNLTLPGLGPTWTFAAVGLLGIPAWAQVTQRVSVSTSGTQGNNDSGSYGLSISADGRFVAFQSVASNLVDGDTNGTDDIFVRDRLMGTTERVSVASSGVQGNGQSLDASISADGRYVAFDSGSSNLVDADTNGLFDVFVRDRQNGTTELVSVSSAGEHGNSASFYPVISADGRYVAFVSDATNLVAGDTNGFFDIFVRDRLTGTTERVSVDSAGLQANSWSSYPSISADGRCVAFGSTASNLVDGDTNGWPDAFVRDRLTGTTERVSVSTSGAQGDAPGGFNGLSISDDGRFVAFESQATDLVSGNSNSNDDVFVRDRLLGTTERVSVDSAGGQADSSSRFPSISADGRFVVFDSAATNLVAGDTNHGEDVFVHDRQTGTTERVSVDSAGIQANTGASCPFPACRLISGDGRYVAFESAATNLVAGDTNSTSDAFVHDRTYSAFVSLCEPGAGGVLSCPCSNPPSGPGRGCDNSSGTGGAILSASGVAYLSADSLVFEADLEKPSALSIVMQGNAGVSAGAPYGQGIRCLGGSVIRRLYIKTAFYGTISAPDFGSGDPQVSVRSAEKGDVIQAADSRWYLVYYRDPIVLGGCPAGSTFNATPTGQVTWLP